MNQRKKMFNGALKSRLRGVIVLLAGFECSGCSSPPAAPAATPTPTSFSADLNRTSVFMGASIVNYWPLPIHNAGVVGQTTTQILARFPVDVLGHGYARVIILGGTNDILQHTKDLPDELTDNLQAMAVMAKGEGMQVILCELPPATSNGVDLNATVTTVDAAIKQLAAQQGYPVADFFSPMYGHPEYFTDGIHPNAAGYSVMEKALSAVVAR